MLGYITMPLESTPSSRTLSQWILRILLLSSCTCYVGMLQTPFFFFLVMIPMFPYSAAVIIQFKIFNKLNWILCMSFQVHLSDVVTMCFCGHLSTVIV